MNYERVYDELIAFRQSNPATGYTENHHILPRSLNGSDDETNLVRLTAREHYVAHLLLTRFNRCSQTVYALWMMQCRSKFHDERPAIKSGRMYEWARAEFSKYISTLNKTNANGEANSQFGTRWKWVSSVTLQRNLKIKLDAEIPEGYVKGYNLWIPKKIRQRKPRVRQAKQKEQTIELVKNLKMKYHQLDDESKRALFGRITQNENISIGSLYTYW